MFARHLPHLGLAGALDPIAMEIMKGILAILAEGGTVG